MAVSHRDRGRVVSDSDCEPLPSLQRNTDSRLDKHPFLADWYRCQKTAVSSFQETTAPADRQRVEQRLNAQYAVSSVLAKSSTLQQAAPHLLQTVAEAASWQLGVLWTPHPHTDQCDAAGLWHTPALTVAEFAAALGSHHVIRGVGLPGRVWQTGASAWNPDVSLDPDFPLAPLALGAGLPARLAFPIQLEAEPLGVLEFFAAEALEPDPATLDMMEAVGRQIGQFMARCQAEDALRRSEADLRNFLETAPIGLHWVGPDGRILEANQAELDLLGYTRDEYVGRPLADFHEDPSLVEEILRRLQRGDTVRDHPARLRCKDGSIRHVLISSNALFEQGRFVHARCFTRDVTEQTRAEAERERLNQELQRRVVELQTLFEAAPIGVWIAHDRECQRITGNRTAELMMQAWTGANLSRNAPSDEGVPFEVLRNNQPAAPESLPLQRACRTGKPVENDEHEIVLSNGKRVTIMANAVPLFDEYGQVRGGLAMSVDITDRKRTEAILRESEARFRHLAEAMPQMAWIARPDGEIDYYNQRWYDFTGVHRVGLEVWNEIVHPEDLARCLENWRNAVQAGQFYQTERRLREGRTGTYRWFLTRAVPVRNEHGQIVRWYGTSTDIDAQKHAEERFVRVSETLVSVLSAIPDIVFVTGPDGRVEFKNSAAAKFAQAIHVEELLPPPIHQELDQVLQTGAHHLPTNLKAVHCFLMDREERCFLNRIVAMKTADQNIFGAVVILQDVTEFRLLDEVKSNLISTVSHELKTPLTSLRTAVLLLLEQAIGGLNQKQVEMLTVVRDETERLLRTLNSLMDLRRFEENATGMRLEAVAAATLVQTAVDETSQAAEAEQMSIRVDIEGSLPPLRVDRDRIVHVLTNFLTNAIKYSPAGSEVLVRVRREEAEQIRFSVCDRGPGVPPEYRTRVFEKFFRVPGSAKKGAGLGLSIAREFVRAHGGRLGVNSEPGQGSEFYFILPVQPA